MKHVVNFSGGWCSFWAAKRVVDKYGTSDVTLLFADTLVEDLELYAFNAKASSFLGVKFTRVSKEMTPWQLFRKEGMIGNNRFPICSIYLKREPLDDWIELNCDPSNTIIYLGFDWTEEHRLEDIQKRRPLWQYDAPMTKPPIWDKCRMQKEAMELGFKLPKLYELGFPHFNCGGRCVRAGISHWVHLFRTMPERYTEWEIEERDTIKDLTDRGISSPWFSMLKDRRGGITKSMTLETLRMRIEAGEDLERNDWGGCGCGGVFETQLGLDLH